MNREEIIGRVFEVDILKTGKDGDTLCFEVYSEELGKFVISNCQYTSDPRFFVEAKKHLIGNALLQLSDESTWSFRAELNIYNDSPKNGFVFLDR